MAIGIIKRKVNYAKVEVNYLDKYNWFVSWIFVTFYRSTVEDAIIMYKSKFLSQLPKVMERNSVMTCTKLRFYHKSHNQWEENYHDATSSTHNM
jgi:hypothetical protein